jgi:hypothetical protein
MNQKPSSTAGHVPVQTLLLSYVVLCLWILLAHKVEAQVSFWGKLEGGYLGFQHATIDIDPGPGWQGMYLETSGLEVSVTGGLSFASQHLFAGLGMGYLNFQCVHGILAFTDFEYLPLKKRISPLVNLRLGYSHLWNQYEGGTGTLLASVGAGVNYRMTSRLSLYLKSGVMITQQALLLPATIGLRY